jgi:hypothetical protein
VNFSCGIYSTLYCAEGSAFRMRSDPSDIQFLWCLLDEAAGEWDYEVIFWLSKEGERYTNHRLINYREGGATSVHCADATSHLLFMRIQTTVSLSSSDLSPFLLVKDPVRMAVFPN